eukprot:127502_1
MSEEEYNEEPEQEEPEQEEPEQEYEQEPEQEYGNGNQEEPEQEQEVVVEQEVEPEPEYKEPEPEPEQNYDDDGQQPESLEQAWNEICTDNPSFNWYSVKLVDPKLKKADLKMDKTGKGGLNEIVKYLNGESANIVFFLLRVNTYDGEGSKRAKFLYGRFVGGGVPFMSKAKLTPNHGQIAEQFPVRHLSIDCNEEMEEFTPEKLSKEFLRIGGAHKPSKYDYGKDAIFNVPQKKKKKKKIND